MKHRVAIFATGWSQEILSEYMKGIQSGFRDMAADVYLFMSFPTLGDTEEFINGELNIFELPDLHDFAGACILANGLDFPGVLERLCERCEEAGIPVVFTGKDDGKHYFVGADNYVGARQMAEHLILEHQAKSLFFIAGNKGNMDSDTRLQALKDVLEAEGGTLPEKQIFYSNWDPKTVIYFVRDWMEQKKELPDAFVCANDMLAMIVCSELRNYGVSVPEDVAVTGFDNEFFAQIYDPSISSVDQCFEKIGEEAAGLLRQLWEGKTCAREKIIPCKFVPSESCGCLSARDFANIRREIGRNKYLDNINNSAFYRKLSLMERGILQGKSYQELKDNLKWIHDSFNNYEGDSFHILLDPMFERIILEPGRQFRTKGYPPVMDVVFSMDEKNYQRIDGFESRKIVPQIRNENRNHFFICMPLQENGSEMGYVIFADDYGKLKDSESMQKYVERLSIVLSKYLQTLSVDVLNQKLLELSETDGLTHVKNRLAYQAREELLKKQVENNSRIRFAVAVFDLNNLKQINDTYGHENGDIYILNACELILKIFKRSAVYRIGGDEFAVILEGDDYRDRKRLLESLKAAMESSEKNSLTYERISIACGVAEFRAGSDQSIADVFQRADDRMYADKQAMKAAKRK